VTELSKKLKLALDETRMLMLGANILLGFQLRGAFVDRFDEVPSHAQYLDGVALLLMVAAVVLLCAPGPYHRIVEEGNDSGEFHGFVTVISDLALFPFALALGIDCFITTEQVFGPEAAAAAGLGGTVVALALWYGLPRLARRSTGRQERAMTRVQRGERPKTPLHVKIEQMLTEARVIIPGAQALFGFQLSIVLTQAFEKIPAASQIVHAVSIGLVALSVMLLMAPAAYHRIVYAGEDAAGMHRVGSWLVTAATAPLAFGLAGDIYVVIAKIAGPAAGGAAAVLGLIGLLGLWYAYPLAVAALRGSAAPAPSAQSR
jgi:hypothetical protein